MNFIFRKAVTLIALAPCFCNGQQTPFSGNWNIDLRSAEERKQNVDCGSATFELLQVGQRISGNHYMSTPRCGRVNEGGPETVKGIAVGSTAMLVVTSGRNGAIVLGRAKLNHGMLQWEATEEIRSGEPEGDSPLILSKGKLVRSKK
ncbi:hypothetical protein RQP54_15725 [Curvibacter sp. APW13]|uniref:hypothetical protein n=1 Tax=Curvibacter sp. APW13 TaxID=3077236 RepID=UPI0028DE0D75|nr:hypothetical protein [Curvibacter sp. APW13]MDT8992322.1 hypothetical protein [Curvibacter sp. APW13]